MSTQTVMPPDMLAASERVQQLQRLITRVGREPSEASFAASLAAASSGSPAETSPQTPMASASAASATAGSGEAGAQTTAYDATIAEVAARYGLDPALLHGLIEQESGFDPSAHSGAGALGLTQLMPATAAALGVSEPLNPTQSIEGGARYLKQMLERFGGNTADALAAYNAGAGAVEQYGGVPPYGETQAYVTKVMADASAYRQSLSMAGDPALLPVASASAALSPSASSTPAAPSMSAGSATSFGPTMSPGPTMPTGPSVSTGPTVSPGSTVTMATGPTVSTGPAVPPESATSAAPAAGLAPAGSAAYAGSPSAAATAAAAASTAAAPTTAATTAAGAHGAPAAHASTGAPSAIAQPGAVQSGATPGTVGGTAPTGTAPIGVAATGGTASLNATGASAAAAGTYGANLQQTIEAVHATIELAAHGGYTQARIALQPEELGEIRVHLSQSAQGLIVRLTASTPSAAAALAAGHGELRQSLSSLGLSALHLEGLVSEHAGAGVGSHAGERGAAHDAALAASARHGQRAAAGSSEGEGEEPADENQLSQLAATTHIVLHGALVDVFA